MAKAGRRGFAEEDGERRRAVNKRAEAIRPEWRILTKPPGRT